jgi:kynureninase
VIEGTRYSLDRAFAQQLDAEDNLAHFRRAFLMDEPELIYMDGNSLGRLPPRPYGRSGGKA